MLSTHPNGKDKKLEALYQLDILDTPNEERFDRITRLASRVFSVPISGIAFLDSDRVWYKSVIGLEVKEVSKENSIESEIIKSDDIYLIPDLTTDNEFSKKELVMKDPPLKFYASIPIRTSKGSKVGLFFIADYDSRDIKTVDTRTLSDLAYWIEKELDNDISDYYGSSEIETIQQRLSTKERELEETILKNTLTFNSIGDGVIILNDKGEITFANEQVEKLTGYDPKEIKGKLLIQVLRLVDERENEIPVFDRPIRNALFLKKKIVNREYFFIKKDGSKFPVAITATPLVIYDNVVGGICVFRDITQEYEIDRMKTEFISLASHQLRTPLSAMKWFAEMLLDNEAGQLTEEQQEIMQNIYSANERMIELVGTLLNISRIESGRLIIDPQPTDIQQLIEEVLDELEPKIKEKDHHIALSVHAKLPKIKIDPKLIRHAYLNLLTNSIKYTPPKGEIVIMVSKSGNEVISQISDNGYGIPKNQQDKVFSKFFRAKNILKTDTDGSGLGLYLTESIVKASGGKIWFESNEDSGTTFWMILPLAGSQPKEGEVSLES